MGIIVRNQGQIIISTNYYETELCKKGIVHCSVNDKCFRILLPPRIGEFGKNGENVENAERSVKAVREMRCAKRVLIGIDETDNGRLFCFTFDDETDLPYRLFLSEVQVSPNISAESIFETDGLSVRIYAWNDTRDIFFEAAHFDAFHEFRKREVAPSAIDEELLMYANCFVIRHFDLVAKCKFSDPVDEIFTIIASYLENQMATFTWDRHFCINLGEIEKYLLEKLNIIANNN